jgi:hypothetical protein
VKVTLEMIEAARRAEYDYYQKGRQIGAGRFIPTPDPVIKAMLEAAFREVPDDVAASVKPAAIVTAREPRHRRR